MNWRIKAAIQKVSDRLPYGERLYTVLQKRLGTLDDDPGFRLPHAATILRMLGQVGFSPVDKSFLEVGTGHRLIVPLGLFLAGARRVHTLDLHTRLDYEVCSGNLRRLVHDSETYWERLFKHLIPRDMWEERMALVRKHVGRPQEFLKAAGISYLAPADAARTGLPDGSVDCHFSVTTLEHIPQPVLVDIMLEARRLLAPGGLSVHLVDPEDHFHEQDPSINSINFLRYSSEQWERIAGNQFGFTNRLRASQYMDLFGETGFEVVAQEKAVDEDALTDLETGFALHPDFQGFEAEDICTNKLRVVLKPRPLT